MCVPGVCVWAVIYLYTLALAQHTCVCSQEIVLNFHAKVTDMHTHTRRPKHTHAHTLTQRETERERDRAVQCVAGTGPYQHRSII